MLAFVPSAGLKVMFVWGLDVCVGTWYGELMWSKCTCAEQLTAPRYTLWHGHTTLDRTAWQQSSGGECHVVDGEGVKLIRTSAFLF